MGSTSDANQMTRGSSGVKCFLVAMLVFCFTTYAVIQVNQTALSGYMQQLPQLRNSSQDIVRLVPLSPSVVWSNASKVKHIGFLKVHKAGSTTMQNLFFRFGLKHNLDILLPKSGNYFNNPSLVVKKKKPGQYFDILAVHTVYDKERLRMVLPPDSVYIGIVRDPLERMISAAYYYRDVFGISYLKKIPKDNFIRSIVNQPDKFDRGRFSYTKNSMARDFGFPSTLKQNDSRRLQQLLDNVKNEFQLVLVMEMFDESLVLMKNYLHWSMSDILYMKTNNHAHTVISLTDKELSKFRSTCFIDYALYESFKQELERKLKLQNQHFWGEVRKFKEILLDVASFCTSSNRSALTMSSSLWNEEFEVTLDECRWMKTKEIPFITKIRNSMTRQN